MQQQLRAGAGGEEQQPGPPAPRPPGENKTDTVVRANYLDQQASSTSRVSRAGRGGAESGRPGTGAWLLLVSPLHAGLHSQKEKKKKRSCPSVLGGHHVQIEDGQHGAYFCSEFRSDFLPVFFPKGMIYSVTVLGITNALFWSTPDSETMF